ncbi:PAS domain S-box protein [Halovenus sp. WSH3]|uniref:histidine kinase n=1 Tax=Halovenus carboxidivorans TaxID=2692199 RepID=A0A6B0TIN8_9EURY|nr:PAS domain S-box protein [Halovenus carboxidivorans]MXR53069.1 PAS domain S-box protein [Halovenus carboxidivorans]
METPDGIDVLYLGRAETVADTLERTSDSLRVETVDRATDALDRLDAANFDCLVSEYALPESTGIDALREVRTDRPAFPVVLYADGSEELASEAISAGVTEYVPRQGGGPDSLAAGIRDAVDQCRHVRSAAESQRRLSLFIEQSPLGVIEWNRAFEAVRVNPAAEEILGYSESELVGRSWETIVPESEQTDVAGVIDRLRESAEGFHSVNQNLRKDGERITCEWHNRAVTDDDGDVVAIYSQFQDITKRRSRTEAIADLHDIVDELTRCSTREAIYERTVEAARGILDFDQVAIATEEDGYLTARALSDASPINERTKMPVDEGIAGKTYRNDECYVIDDVREEDAAQPQSDLIRSALSVPISGYGVFQVIDRQPAAFDQQDLELARLLVQHVETALARLEREQTLEQIRDHVEFALETTDSVVWAVDLGTGEITTRLGPSRRLFGLGEEEITTVGDFLEQAVHPSDAERIREVSADAVSGDGEFDVVYRTNQADDQTRWVEATGFVRSADQQRMIGLTTDVTERERRERELERQNERLEEFASVVSHDLRNPLQVANSWLELAKEEPKSEYLDNIAQAHERMDVLIEELLELAREGGRALDTEEIDLAESCRACWQTVDTAEATLSVEVERTLTADRNRFRQLLANLFRNAVEHGGEDVAVTVAELPDGFYVEDDGPGIDPEEREEVFESGHSATEDGTGFGLSIVARVADAHGWEVGVAEGDAGGARFEITGVSSLSE